MTHGIDSVVETNQLLFKTDLPNSMLGLFMFRDQFVLQAASLIGNGLRLLVIGISCASLAALSAEDGDEDDKPISERSELRAWVDVYSEVAGRHKFRLAETPETALELHPKPLQVYSHPSGLAGTHGAFYVWTNNGRPEVVGSIWSYEAAGNRRTLVHEFDSLATTPLAEIEIVPQGVWKQRRSIEPLPVPDAPKPAASTRLRAAQMRELAARFEGYSTNNGSEVQLRMLTREIYLHQPTVKGAGTSGTGDVEGDAGLFCFFADWDPEIMLLIESRPTPDGPRWYYSAARFNICPMWLKYQDKKVWHVEPEPNTAVTFGDPAGPFFAAHEVAALPKIAPGPKAVK